MLSKNNQYVDFCCSEVDSLLYIFPFINIKKLFFIRGIVVNGRFLENKMPGEVHAGCLGLDRCKH